MNTSELKLKIFREIDTLEKSKLEDFYGVLVNFLNSQRDFEEWQNLTDEQQQGILDAVEEVKHGEVIAHEEVVLKYRNKYSNG